MGGWCLTGWCQGRRRRGRWCWGWWCRGRSARRREEVPGGGARLPGGFGGPRPARQWRHVGRPDRRWRAVGPPDLRRPGERRVRRCCAARRSTGARCALCRWPDGGSGLCRPAGEGGGVRRYVDRDVRARRLTGGRGADRGGQVRWSARRRSAHRTRVRRTTDRRVRCTAHRRPVGSTADRRGVGSTADRKARRAADRKVRGAADRRDTGRVHRWHGHLLAVGRPAHRRPLVGRTDLPDLHGRLVPLLRRHGPGRLLARCRCWWCWRVTGWAGRCVRRRGQVTGCSTGCRSGVRRRGAGLRLERSGRCRRRGHRWWKRSRRGAARAGDGSAGGLPNRRCGRRGGRSRHVLERRAGPRRRGLPDGTRCGR
ncbi:hypothetical protein GA0070618_4256 [Micromonospora echinospora]|uniref:Uncharacterized protein n=1 Tax=Micromonospora echinospora TaxID=1877 RepID=A0A1C4YQP8_MICEC|nr:hypothetical protein GA0070618_4256 [Micromonospora echinospora]